MPVLSRILLIPLLAPLLAVLLLGALNPRPSVSLRLLVWSTPALPLGLWLTVAGLGGAALSGATTALALGQSSEPLQRTVRRERRRSEPWQERWSEAQEQVPFQPPPRPSSGPERAATEPPPTLSVPFRVIRQGRSTSSATGTTSSARSPAPAQASGADGWEQPLSDAW